jgi:bifunctional enzyme CysN/CysC
LEALDAFKKAPPHLDRPLRFPVQAIYKFTNQGDDRRIVAGRVESGRAKVGDTVFFSPSNKSSVIKSIEVFNAPPRDEMGAGWSTGFTLTEEIYITRGELMSHTDSPPLVSTRFRANMIWLGKKPFVKNRDYKLKIHTQAVPVRLHEIKKVVDASDAGKVMERHQVGRHDVADVVLESKQPIAFDDIGQGEATARFVLVDGYDIAGGGTIVSAERDSQEDLREEARLRDFHWIKGGVSSQERTHRFGHRAALVMFVGKAGVGKHRYARTLEKDLFQEGHATYMLDGTNILLGVDSDMIWTQSTQQELVRRFAEVAHLLLDAGLLVVSTTNAIGLADVAAVQTLIPDFPVLAIEINTEKNALSCADLRLTGQEPNPEAAAKIITLLTRQTILFPKK